MARAAGSTPLTCSRRAAPECGSAGRGAGGCRPNRAGGTAAAAGARAVLALAFPLHPPGHPERSRAAELRAAGTDILVLNGDRDPFGLPGTIGATRVIVLPGET